MNGVRPGRPKGYDIFEVNGRRAFLGCVRGVTNERQARRRFTAEAAALGFPVAIEELAARYDPNGMETPSSSLIAWREEEREYVYRAYDPNVDLEDGFFELVRTRYPTVDEYHFVGGSIMRSRFGWR